VFHLWAFLHRHHGPTYQNLGDELDQPGQAGRIYLESRGTCSSTLTAHRMKRRQHIDTLPVLSGLYDDLGPLGRCTICIWWITPATIIRKETHGYKRALQRTRALRWVLARILPYPTTLSAGAAGGQDRAFRFARLMPDCAAAFCDARRMAPKDEPPGPKPQR